MGDELENQMQYVENMVAELLAAVRTLCDDRAARPTGAADVNQRLRRFLADKA
jgi:hypothetical protein